MQQTGKTAEYSRLSEGCASCEAFVGNVSRIYRGGGTIEFSGSQIVRIEEFGTASRFPTFDITVKSQPATVSLRGKVTSYPGGRQVLRVTLLRHDREWRVTSFSRLPT